MYGLRHPSQILADPWEKDTFNKFVKKKVIDYWEQKLRDESKQLKSLTYFKPEFMSLSSPHPLFTLAGNSPYKVTMATIQACLLSGRYRFDSLTKHWSSKVTGYCYLSPLCRDQLDDVVHMLKNCSPLQPTRQKMIDFTLSYSKRLPHEVSFFLQNNCIPSNEKFCQLLMDCSVIPEVIVFKQNFGPDILAHLFNITRTWIYVLHRERTALRLAQKPLND